MSKKIEKILDLLVNEEIDQAESLLHDLVVEKARHIYEGLVNEEDYEDDEDDEEVDESFGGDMKSNFVQEVEADKDDIEGDEQADGEAGMDDMGMEYDDGEEGDEFGDDEFGGDDMDMGMEEEDMEDVVLDVRDQLEQLRADFEALLGQGEEEPYQDEEEFAMMGDDDMEDDMGMDDMGMEPEMDEMRYMEGLEEATKLQDPVADPGMKREGQFSGTGKHSKTGATGTQSPYTKAPTKSMNGERPVDWSKGSTGGEYKGPAGGDTTSAKNDTPSSNIDVTHKEENKLDLTGSQTGQNSEGKFSGTGKNSKTGATHTKSPLSTAPKKP